MRGISGMNLTRTRIGLGTGFKVAYIGGLQSRMAGSLRIGSAQNAGSLLSQKRLESVMTISRMSSVPRAPKIEMSRFARPAGISSRDVPFAEMETSEAVEKFSKMAAAEVVDLLDQEGLGQGSFDFEGSELVSGLSEKRVAEILYRLNPSFSREILEVMNPEVRGNISSYLRRYDLDELNIDERDSMLKRAGIGVENEGKERTEILNYVGEYLEDLAADQEKDDFGQLHLSMRLMDEEDEKRINNDMKKSESDIFTEMDRSSAVSILNKLSLKRKIEIIEGMGMGTSAAKVLAAMEPSEAIKILNGMEYAEEEKSLILSRMTPLRAARILEEMDPAEAKRLFDADVLSAEILKNMKLSSAANIVAKMDSYAKSSILAKMEPIEAIILLAEQEPVEAGKILMEKFTGTDKRSKILIQMSIHTISKILAELAPYDAIDLLGTMDIPSEAKILAEMDLRKSVEIINYAEDFSNADRILDDTIFNDEELDKDMFNIFSHAFPRRHPTEQFNEEISLILNDPNISDEKVIEILSRIERQAELFNELNADRMVRIAQMGFVPEGGY